MVVMTGVVHSLSSLLATFVLLLLGYQSLVVEACNPVCNSLYTPHYCLGSISGIFTQTGLTTAGKPDQDTFDCGSRNTNLNDVIIQFVAGVSGTYQISTEDIGSFDTTLQVERCDAAVIACNDDRSSTDKSSFVSVSLTSGQNYIIAVSKKQSSDPEPTFTLRIQALGGTVSPTSASPTSSSPTVPTKSPTVATKSPLSKSPTLSPTHTPSNSPTKSNSPGTSDPNGPPATSNPTTDVGGGSAPTSNLGVGVGGGLGGLAALALGIVVGKRTLDKRREARNSNAGEIWTAEEEARLRTAFHTTHDMNSIYPMFPNHSRESIAFRTRQLLQSQSSFFSMATPRFAKSTYMFVQERKRALTSKFSSKDITPPGARSPHQATLILLSNHDYNISTKNPSFRTPTMSSFNDY